MQEFSILSICLSIIALRKILSIKILLNAFNDEVLSSGYSEHIVSFVYNTFSIVIISYVDSPSGSLIFIISPTVLFSKPFPTGDK